MSRYKRIKPKKNEPKFARKLGRIGMITRQPLAWAACSVAMARSENPGLRRASVRGSACYVAGALAGNLPKPLFQRAQPRHLNAKKPQVMRGSFPSGHGAAEVAYVFGAAQEVPALFLPLGTAAMLGHWSLIRAGKHYVTDLLAGGVVGMIVAFVAARTWPRTATPGPVHSQ